MSKADFWVRHLAAIEQEGVSTKAYAEREGVSVASLYHWRNKLQRRGKARERGLGGDFVAVQWADVSPTTPSVMCTLRLAGGLTLECSVLPSAQWLVALDSAMAQETH
jgi:transposase